MTDTMPKSTYNQSNTGGSEEYQGPDPLEWTPTVRDLTDEQTSAALHDGYTSDASETVKRKPRKKTPERHEETGQFVGDEATYDDDGDED